MDFDQRPSTPSWVDFAPNSVRGLDLLGLRLPVQAIGLSLLDAVTTISPRVRYLSFRTFVADAYRTAPGPPPDSYDAFMSFAVPAETAFALGNALVEPDATNIVGIDKAHELLTTESEQIIFERLVAQPALTLYARPAETLGLVGIRPEGAPSVGRELGQPSRAAIAGQTGAPPQSGNACSEVKRLSQPIERTSRSSAERAQSANLLDERTAAADRRNHARETES